MDPDLVEEAAIESALNELDVWVTQLNTSRSINREWRLLPETFHIRRTRTGWRGVCHAVNNQGTQILLRVRLDLKQQVISSGMSSVLRRDRISSDSL